MWDLLLWKGKELQFVELKRSGKDRIRSTQVEFLKWALNVGFDLEHFEVWEWDVKLLFKKITHFQIAPFQKIQISETQQL